MKIQFTITVNNFLDAASIEELLKEKRIKYCVDSDCTPAIHTKRKKRTPVTEKMIRDVKNHFRNHPNDTFENAAKAFNSSRSTIERIYNNKHILQRKT
jgi:hypothetical protein